MNQDQDDPVFKRSGKDPVHDALARLEDPAMNAQEKQALWDRIRDSQQRQIRNGRKRRIYKVVAIAALLFVLCTVGIWFFREQAAPAGLVETARQQQYLIPGSREVNLNTTAQVLKFQSDSTIDYKSLPLPDKARPDVVYNTLTVPYGQRSEIVLPDGSSIWMNAGSQLTFPVEFASDHRDVYLEGEAFFDIAHDSSRPFTVQTADMEIKVLGTSFNLSTYKEDAVSSVYLITGQIELSGTESRDFTPQRLQPGQMARLDKAKNHLVLDLNVGESEVLWRRKQLRLDSTPVADLIRKLERMYNTEIAISDNIQSSETFSGRLDLSQPLDKVLGFLYDLKNVQIIQTERRIEVHKK